MRIIIMDKAGHNQSWIQYESTLGYIMAIWVISVLPDYMFQGIISVECNEMANIVGHKC